ncbi:MAG: polysaccharide biosynthesis protein [Microthrixaceae bacterium]
MPSADRFAPEELMMLDRDESGLTDGVQLSIEGRALLNDPSVILVDIRDADALLKVFRERKPQVVFHAGAQASSTARAIPG